MHPRSSRDLRIMAERMMVRAATPWYSERHSQRLRDRASILVEAAHMAERRETNENARTTADPVDLTQAEAAS